MCLHCNVHGGVTTRHSGQDRLPQFTRIGQISDFVYQSWVDDDRVVQKSKNVFYVIRQLFFTVQRVEAEDDPWKLPAVIAFFKY